MFGGDSDRGESGAPRVREGGGSSEKSVGEKVKDFFKEMGERGVNKSAERNEKRENVRKDKAEPGPKSTPTVTPAAPKPTSPKKSMDLGREDIKQYKESQSGEIKKISKELSKGAKDINKETEAYRNKLKELEEGSTKLDKQAADLAKEQSDFATKQLADTQKLTKWHEGIATSYEDIAKRYRDEMDRAFSGEEKARQKKAAQQDYLTMQALGGKAMQIGLGAGGPVTGSQQQILMAQSGAAASDAYSAALNRISAIEEQRRAMGFQVAGASMQQELANRQAGYAMQEGQIKTEAGVMMNKFNTNMQALQDQRQGLGFRQGTAGQSYQAALGSIEANVNAAVYAPEAQIALNNAAMQHTLGIEGLNVQRETGTAAANAYSNMPGPYQPSAVQKFFTGALGGAGTGAAIGTSVSPGYGTAIGAGIGFLGGGLMNAMS